MRTSPLHHLYHYWVFCRLPCALVSDGHTFSLRRTPLRVLDSFITHRDSQMSWGLLCRQSGPLPITDWYSCIKVQFLCLELGKNLSKFVFQRSLSDKAKPLSIRLCPISLLGSFPSHVLLTLLPFSFLLGAISWTITCMWILFSGSASWASDLRETLKPF